ncbi:MAG: adenosine kinase [Ignavibacteria bacterium]|nr:adenosine kinase [Ignavibacteria bacterium]
MKNTLLTGIGNALVDIEFNVTEEELQAFDVPKSTMTLTGASRQSEIIASLNHREQHKSSGGSVANSIIAFAQFGGSAAFCSLLGDDTFGRFYTDEFNELGVTLNAHVASGLPTGSCLVLITPDRERTMITTLGVNIQFSRKNVDEQLIAQSEWLYIEGYKLSEEEGADAIEIAAFYARKHGTNIAVSCSDTFIVNEFGDRLESLLSSTDLIFCNEREGRSLANEENADDAYMALASRYRNIVFTMGAAGSKLKWNGKECDIPAYAIPVVDTTGAGDMYAGAFLYGVLHRQHPEFAGRLASYAAAQVVGQYGARLKANHIEIRDSILRTAATTND